MSNPAEITSFRGAFLFRDTGLGNNAVNAYDDAGQVPSPAGGTAVANVLANDWVAGAPATLANVNMTQESSTSPGVTLDLADGSVDVAPGTTATTHTLIYKICAKANPANCDGAAVRVTVPPYVVKAVNDTGSISPAVGGSAIASVLSNDTVGSARATTANVTVVQISSTSGGVTLDPSDGSVDVAIGTANGTYSLLYRICEIANPSNCDQATATVTVIPNVVDAVDDSARASSKTGGVAIASVLVNDKVGTARATAATVRLSMVSAPIPGITLDVNTGAVLVAPKTQSGLYSFVYQICEIVSPANCDRATVALDLSGK